MAQTSKAQTDKDFLTRLADRGEQVVGRITDLPGAKQLIDTTGALAKRMDTMQKQLRSLDPLQKRVTAIEHRLDKLESKETTRRRTTTRKTTAAKAKSTTSRSSGSKS